MKLLEELHCEVHNSRRLAPQWMATVTRNLGPTAEPPQQTSLRHASAADEESDFGTRREPLVGFNRHGHRFWLENRELGPEMESLRDLGHVHIGFDLFL